MIPLQVASSGRPWNGTYKQKQNALRIRKGLKGVGVRKKKTEKCTLSGLPDDPSAGCLIPVVHGTEPTSRNRTYKNQ